MHRHSHWVAAGLCLVGLGMTACGTGTAEYGEIGQQGPAQVAHVAGTEITRVTLTAEAARKLGVRTATVAGAAQPALSDDAATAPEITVPLDAVIYDKDGTTWVYTVAGPNTFQRQAVSIARVTGDSVVLKSGPRPGTRVVTVGAEELLGAELGVGGE